MPDQNDLTSGVMITYHSGVRHVYKEDDPRLLGVILNSFESIDEIDFVEIVKD